MRSIEGSSYERKHVSNDRDPSAELESVIGKAAFDEAFAEELVDDPAAALRSVGVEPTDEMLEALSAIDAESLKKLAAAFEPQPGIG